MQDLGEEYWTNRYLQRQTQWDTGSATSPITAYFDQLSDKDKHILIPGCGNAHEAIYLFKNGFSNVFILDISKIPLQAFHKQYPSFSTAQILHGDFFDLDRVFDIIVEQTFFCALNPDDRRRYAIKMHELLKPGGELVGVLFDDTLNKTHPPYGGSPAEYEHYFKDLFEFEIWERCHNSIKPRQDREWFIKLRKPNSQ